MELVLQTLKILERCLIILKRSDYDGLANIHFLKNENQLQVLLRYLSDTPTCPIKHKNQCLLGKWKWTSVSGNLTASLRSTQLNVFPLLCRNQTFKNIYWTCFSSRTASGSSTAGPKLLEHSSDESSDTSEAQICLFGLHHWCGISLAAPSWLLL